VAGTDGRRSGPRPRLLASDIDGTLIDWGGHPSPAVRRAIAAVRASGVHVVLATGRSPWHDLHEIAGAVGLSGPQITLQGALVADPSDGRVVRAQRIDADRLDAILAFAAELGVTASVATTDGYRVIRGTGAAAREGLAGTTPVRVFLPSTPADHPALRREAATRLGDRVAITWGDESGIDLLHPATDKGEALTWLAGELGIPMAEVAAVGDAANDRGMLTAAGSSVAMADAIPEVRAAADIVVRGPHEDGLVDAIAWLFPDLADAVGR